MGHLWHLTVDTFCQGQKFKIHIALKTAFGLRDHTSHTVTPRCMRAPNMTNKYECAVSGLSS